MTADKDDSSGRPKKQGAKKTTKKSTRKTTRSGDRGDRANEKKEAGGDEQEREEQQRGQDSDAAGDGDGGEGRSKLKPMQAARLATQQIRQLTGRTVDGVSAVDRDGDGWYALVEVVEIERVPAATDVIGVYAAALDRDGDLESYERVRRYVRGQAGDDS